MTDIYTGYGKRSDATPQTEVIPGREADMATNNAGGVSFVVDDMTRLSRFLVLGSSSSTYYVKQRVLTKQNLDCVERLLKAGRGLDVVAKVIEISKAGRAPSNDPALFVLARCVSCDVFGKSAYHRPSKTYTLHREHNADLFEKFPEEGVPRMFRNNTVTMVRHGDTITKVTTLSTKMTQEDDPRDVVVRQVAYAALPDVARTGTHLFHYMAFEKQFRGRGSAHRRALKRYYNELNAERLAYQMLKYQQRDGWSQRDILRLTRPKPPDSAHNALYHWSVKGWDGGDAVPAEDALGLIYAFEQAKKLTDPIEVADLVTRYRLPREAVPTQHLNSIKVWEALLPSMPMEAMLRNLATMTKIGVLTSMGEMTRLVCERLRDPSRLLKPMPLHPLKILVALKTYQKGKSQRGDATWTPLREVVDVLNDAFYLSFGCVTPTNQRLMLALDISGSMTWSEIGSRENELVKRSRPLDKALGYEIESPGGIGITPRDGTAALALVTAATEPNYFITAFSTGIMPINISPKQRLDDVLNTIDNMHAGGTDCAQPMLWALHHKVAVDAFIVLTHNETWANPHMHPIQALQRYRKEFGIPAKLIVVGMTSTEFSIADPADRGC